ncbi:hypothetical protein [Nitrosarchaeum sp. AC2]|uniref:hypothetical protein n=1 Tax=Nitrosarchaeum sp. AC2 TaxID=2259673 RepID=UPI0015CADD21|nr:hypothetical protein [Nitrosarchaeum sp. AC2]QLH11291.1 hypothetical protein DSQ20_07305 [Nitrosarchaeum sp. AC2]
MDAEKIKKFVKSIHDFDSLDKSHMILYFGLYLQTEENYEKFTAKAINECFDVFDYEKPKNTQDLLNKLHNRNGHLIPKNGGYRIKKQTADELRSQISINNPVRLERVFKPGEMYDFYKLIQSITMSTQKSVFIVDAYANEDVIDLYLDKLPVGIQMYILTDCPKGNFMNVASKFKQKHGTNFVVKTHKSCHDRLFFSDKTCYVIGQSIDRAANDKPTYVCEIENGGIFRSVFQDLFNKGKTII